MTESMDDKIGKIGMSKTNTKNRKRVVIEINDVTSNVTNAVTSNVTNAVTSNVSNDFTSNEKNINYIHLQINETNDVRINGRNVPREEPLFYNHGTQTQHLTPWLEELVSERMKRCGSKLVLEESKVDFAKLLALQDENRALREMNAKWIEQLAAMDQEFNEDDNPNINTADQNADIIKTESCDQNKIVRRDNATNPNSEYVEVPHNGDGTEKVRSNENCIKQELRDGNDKTVYKNCSITIFNPVETNVEKPVHGVPKRNNPSIENNPLPGTSPPEAPPRSGDGREQHHSIENLIKQEPPQPQPTENNLLPESAPLAGTPPLHNYHRIENLIRGQEPQFNHHQLHSSWEYQEPHRLHLHSPDHHRYRLQHHDDQQVSYYHQPYQPRPLPHLLHHLFRQEQQRSLHQQHNARIQEEEMRQLFPHLYEEMQQQSIVEQRHAHAENIPPRHSRYRQRGSVHYPFPQQQQQPGTIDLNDYGMQQINEYADARHNADSSTTSSVERFPDSPLNDHDDEENLRSSSVQTTLPNNPGNCSPSQSGVYVIERSSPQRYNGHTDYSHRRNFEVSSERCPSQNFEKTHPQRGNPVIVHSQPHSFRDPSTAERAARVQNAVDHVMTIARNEANTSQNPHQPLSYHSPTMMHRNRPTMSNAYNETADDLADHEYILADHQYDRSYDARHVLYRAPNMTHESILPSPINGRDDSTSDDLTAHPHIRFHEVNAPHHHRHRLHRHQPPETIDADQQRRENEAYDGYHYERSNENSPFHITAAATSDNGDTRCTPPPVPVNYEHLLLEHRYLDNVPTQTSLIDSNSYNYYRKMKIQLQQQLQKDNVRRRRRKRACADQSAIPHPIKKVYASHSISTSTEQNSTTNESHSHVPETVEYNTGNHVANHVGNVRCIPTPPPSPVTVSYSTTPSPPSTLHYRPTKHFVASVCRPVVVGEGLRYEV